MKIMAPAGDFDRLVAAIKAGADEVYMGVAGFGARRFAKNFSVEEYASALDYAHRANVEVHLTFNTILSDAELDLVYSDIKRLYEAGLDEVIVQDYGVASWFQSNFPELPLCASTQLSPASALELNWYAEQGFRRAVLARELSLAEIATIRKRTSIELEVFISGALCLGCSGKCYLSSSIGGRSGNRGMCAQPCRQYYRVDRANGALNESDYGYFLSLKDQLQGREEIKALVELGVDSAKIEGRMKSPQYVYATTRYYRDLIDSITGVTPERSERRLSIKRSAEEKRAESQRVDVLPQEEEARRRRDIAALFNRGYDKGFYHETDPDMINEFYASNFGVEVGRVYREAVRLSEPLRNGDGVVFLDDSARKLGGLNVSGVRLVDRTNPRRVKVVEGGEPGDLVRFHEPIPEGATRLYRTFNYRLNKEIENALAQARRREPVAAHIVCRIGEPLRLSLATARAKVELASDENLVEAKKIGSGDPQTLRASLDRFGETPFYLDQFSVEGDKNAFVPKSTLNQLRQEAVAKLERETIESYRRVAPAQQTSGAFDPEGVVVSQLRATSYRAARERFLASSACSRPIAEPSDYLSLLAAKVRTRDQLKACQDFGLRQIYSETLPVQYEGRFRFATSSACAPLAGSITEALRYERKGVPYSLDWFFNVGSSRAVRFLADRFPNASTIYLSPEISDLAVSTLIARLGDYARERGFKLGLPIYGRLLAMITQKTLFNAPNTRLVNADDRRVVVERNASIDESTNCDAYVDCVDDESESTSHATRAGSSLYLDDALDLIDAIPWIASSGISELRLDFTTETYAETLRALDRASRGGSGEFHTFSYGYTRDGVF